jgi:hypothetical protein
MSHVVDEKGLTHEVLYNDQTFCGQSHGAFATAADDAVVTCFQCMHIAGLEGCGHPGAEVQNCPYAAEVRNDRDARCKCCRDCSRNCSEDI